MFVHAVNSSPNPYATFGQVPQGTKNKKIEGTLEGTKVVYDQLNSIQGAQPVIVIFQGPNLNSHQNHFPNVTKPARRAVPHAANQVLGDTG
jgi:hypothetical protein